MGAGSGGSTPRRSGRRRWTIAIVVLVAVVLLLSLPFWFATHPATVSSSLPTGGTVSLLPSPETRSGCIVGTPGVPRPTYALHEGMFQANTYDVPNGTRGHVGMCYNATGGDMFAYANWSEVGPAGGWFSYPQVTYGVNFWDGPFTTYTNMSPAWKLPQTVASVVNESVWTSATYRFDGPPSTDVDGYDLSFDNFFTETLPPVFEVGPFVEVEIFLAHNISYPFEWIPWSTPTVINSTVVQEPWDIGYWCHGVDNGTNPNVSFDFSLGGQSSHGIADGQVGVDLSAVLAEVDALMPGVTCWTGPTHGFGQFHLDEANLGSEDGALGGTSFNYNWTVLDDTIDFTTNSSGTSTSALGSFGGSVPQPALPLGPGLVAVVVRRR